MQRFSHRAKNAAGFVVALAILAPLLLDALNGS